MTVDDFRRLALGLPHAEEGAHMRHPDFRVAGKIFASLPEACGARAAVRLTPDQQEMLTSAEPGMFRRVKGGWGAKGWTEVQLEQADEASLVSALRMAWSNTAPRRLLRSHEGSA